MELLIPLLASTLLLVLILIVLILVFAFQPRSKPVRRRVRDDLRRIKEKISEPEDEE